MVKDALTLIGTAVDLVNQLRGIAQKVKDAETQMVIADLMNALADLKIEVAALKTTNHDLSQEVGRLKALPEPGKGLEFRDGAYYYEVPPAGKSVGPYCPRCYDIDDRLMILTELESAFRVIARWQCPQCDKTFK